MEIYRSTATFGQLRQILTVRLLRYTSCPNLIPITSWDKAEEHVEGTGTYPGKAKQNLRVTLSLLESWLKERNTWEKAIQNFSHHFSQFPLISNEHRACVLPSVLNMRLYEWLGFLVGRPFEILLLHLSQKFLNWGNLPSLKIESDVSQLCMLLLFHPASLKQISWDNKTET